MLLCLDIGNTHILGGVFNQEKLLLRFRYATHLIGTSDQLGIFLVNMLQVKKIDPDDILTTAISSVVPSCDYTIKHTISSYLKSSIFILQTGVKTGLNIKYKNPKEVGSDRIANAIGAVSAFPNKNIIIIDMGTATTVCAINKKRDYLGGTILPGMRLGMEALRSNTAKLMTVDIIEPESCLGRTTCESIQSGLFYGHFGALKEVISEFKKDVFPGEAVTVIGTGGFAQLYKEKSLFDALLPDLVLHGLYHAYLSASSIRES
jgi:type III pantothenate kinase